MQWVYDSTVKPTTSESVWDAGIVDDWQHLVMYTHMPRQVSIPTTGARVEWTACFKDTVNKEYSKLYF